MPKDNTTAPTAKAITDRQLLKHLLDSPYRTGPSSALFKEEQRYSLRDFVFGSANSQCLDYDLPFQVLDLLCESEDPTEDLRDTINDLEDWLGSLRELEREFRYLKDYCRSDDEDADLEVEGSGRLLALPEIASLTT